MQASSDEGPLVSLCIPTFNRMEYLRDCIESICAQSYRPIEIIVSDNLSSDGTRAMLAEMDNLVVNLQKSNVGMVGNWNSAIELATGKYCVLLSDDDVLLPTFVETTVALMENPAVEFAYTAVTIINGAGAAIGTSPSAPLEESGISFVQATLSSQRVPYPSAILFRRAAAQEIGLFVDIGNQTDVAFRIALAERRPGSRVAFHLQPLVKYRIHANSLTDNPAKRIEGRVNLQRWIARRYGRDRMHGRLALFDLLNLRTKGVSLPRDVVDLLAASHVGWFSRRLRLLSMRARLSRHILFSMFPLLSLRHLQRLINNRIFHNRYFP